MAEDTSAPNASSDNGSKGTLAVGLYLVATPIGNLEDIGARAARILADADLVACEDTRVSTRLMAAVDARTPLIAYHDHNADRVRPKLLQKLAEGQAIALISDAGTPLVSDPGYGLVQAVRAAGHMVTAVPGPSAVPTALSLSGLPSDRFLFLGFPPSKSAARKRWFEEVATVPATLIFFESAKRLAASLEDACQVLGDRPAAICRELTKRYEEVVSDRILSLSQRYHRDGAPRGEIVVVVGPPEDGKTAGLSADGTLDAKVETALQQAVGDMGARGAAQLVADLTGLPRKRLYERAVILRNSRKQGAQ